MTGAVLPLPPELADVLPPAPEPLDDRADEQTLDLVAYALSEAPVGLSIVLTYRGRTWLQRCARWWPPFRHTCGEPTSPSEYGDHGPDTCIQALEEMLTHPPDDQDPG